MLTSATASIGRACTLTPPALISSATFCPASNDLQQEIRRYQDLGSLQCPVSAGAAYPALSDQ